MSDGRVRMEKLRFQPEALAMVRQSGELVFGVVFHGKVFAEKNGLAIDGTSGIEPEFVLANEPLLMGAAFHASMGAK